MADIGLIQISKSNYRRRFTYGSKGLNLQKAKTNGFAVPDGILVSVEFLNELISSLCDHNVIRKFDSGKVSAERWNNECVKKLGNKGIVQNELTTKLDEALRKIEGPVENTFFAVRSAALNEDNSEYSFAGQYETVLFVKRAEVLSAVLKCYASCWSDRIRAYKSGNNSDRKIAQISLIIQKQLNPEFSGVAYTKDPVGTEKCTVIEAVTGIGDKLVSGKVKPARWKLESGKHAVLLMGPEKDHPASIIPYSIIEQVHLLGKRLERYFGKDLDIEWASQNGKVYLLQVRKITANATNENLIRICESHYCRTIIEDLWADRMTNITSSITLEEYVDVFTFKSQFKRLKLNKLVSISPIKVINGFGYINSILIARLLELLPISLRVREIANSFPEYIRQQVLMIKPLKRLQLKTLLRIPLIFNDPAIVPFLTSPILKRFVKKKTREILKYENYRGLSSANYKEELNRLIGLLSQLQSRNQWGYGNAAAFTWITYHIATRFLKRNDEWILNELSRIPGNITLDLQKRLLEICDLCDQDLITEVFDNPDIEHGWQTLITKYSDHIVTSKIKKLIEDYRYRSNNRDFIHPRWDEKPVFVLDHLSLLLKSREDIGMAEVYNKHYKLNNGDKRFLLTKLLLLPLLFQSKKMMALREDLRFGLDVAFYKIRQVLLAISEVEEFNIPGLRKDWIFFVELNELRAILDQPHKIMYYITPINERRLQYEEDKGKSPPYYVRVDGDTIKDLDSKVNVQQIYNGLPASTGIAEGRAVIIHEPSEFSKMRNGEILIAYNTDPGWTPLFLCAKGVVIEMGGLLNHCAIVAREYRIPAVVGVPQVTKKLQDGQLVRVNGFTGVIEVLSE